MSFYSLNRAAINAGVVSFVAGAALLVASSTVGATALKEVPGGASFSAVSGTQVTGVRNVLGGGSFVSEVGLSAFPALLQLQTATIVATGQLKATYTNSWINPTSELSGSGTVIRPGSGVLASTLVASAVPLVNVGFTSTILCASWATADASVQRSGQSTTERDGYAVQGVSSGFTANGLRTALVYVRASGTSEYTADGTKVHGSGAYLAGVLSVGAIASTDLAKSYATSDFTALPELTHAGGAVLDFIGSLSADPVLYRFGEAAPITGTGELSAAGRLALLGAASVTGASSAMNANGRLALLGAINTSSMSALTANGTRVCMGEAVFAVALTSRPQWSLIRDSDATLVAFGALSATGFTNAESPDPESRTMRRLYTERTVGRPFVDRVMRRYS